MSILVINSGSTSVKYKLFTHDEEEIKQGNITNITDHQAALKQVLRDVGGLQDLTAIGHRVVHGGHKFFKPLLVNQDNFSELEQFNNLAPLHNPYNLAGIKATMEYLPHIKQVAVFDTAFYANLPLVNRLYGLPRELTEKYKIYRYGFHGTSHKYVMQESAKLLKTEINKINLITCHLGGGWSITAIKNGQPIDTSMGMTPLEGLVMMTRAGDIDPGIIFKLLEEMPEEINQSKVAMIYDLLNQQSGIKGLFGVNDFQKLLKMVSLGNKEANLAFDLAINRLVKYIGAFWVELEGKVQAIVFTGAVGAGNPMTRNQVMQKITCLGKLPMLAIQTNEELMIAREIRELILTSK
ncbi:acetate/propionate family kinase [Patescibacteria group bacterium]|nr:acetate/propionate family kinase [Patescibacteria group bacterium]MBU1663245.1 acetate/propionate family kinase [Patescibacteria group bacterium]MBU2007894.1 acetate/propionate family kinase [Patescibacteria group bacterium]MBU2233363.1 acetate/propionate family kinase [Patescibacteria group bacterium]MBU2263981.1 acetate/propionate family kinase [Patescibacteria group bacterium]